MSAFRLRPAAAAASLAGLLLAGLCAAQGPAAQGTAAHGHGAPAPKVAPAAKAATKAPAETRPAWTELTPDQQQALKPLAGSWPTMSEPQKRKWIALSRNFRQMKPEEQAKLHSRMNEWVALSPQQRTAARLNFAEAQSVPPDDRKAKWEAYQALPPEEKRKLAAGAPSKPSPAAAVKPVPPQKLANVPRPDKQGKSPRIASGPADTVPPASPPGNTHQ